MPIDWPAVAQVLDAIAWPVAGIFVAIVLRVPLLRLASGLGNRITSVGIGKFSIELAPAALKEFRPKWKIENEDIGGLTGSDVFDSASTSLYEQLMKQGEADYVMIDLADGEAWLTSRLFLFSVVLGQVNDLRSFVFVADRALGPSGYVGHARPNDIRRCLARSYPWLEAALFKARQTAVPLVTPAHDQAQSPDLKSLAEANADMIRMIAFQYISNLQWPGQLDPTKKPQDWLQFTDKHNNIIWEKAQWLTPRTLDILMGDALEIKAFVDSSDMSTAARASQIVRRTGDYVAQVDEGRRFVDLIDRKALIDRHAWEFAGRIET